VTPLIQNNQESECQHVLKIWRFRCIRATIQHYRSTHLYRFLDSILTSTNVIASISVLYLSASPLFVANGDKQVHISLAVAALITVITSTLQYILDYRSKWKAHEHAISGYASLNREMEQLCSEHEITNEQLKHVRIELDRLSERSPTIAWVFWNRPKDISAALVRLESRSRDHPDAERA